MTAIDKNFNAPTPAPHLPFTPSSTIPRSTVQTAIDYVYSWFAALVPAVGAAPKDAQYLVAEADSTLTAERVTTDTATVAWDHTTAAQAKANVPNDAISDAKLRNSAAVSVIGRSANSSGDPADIVAASNDRVLARAGDALAFSQVTAAMLAADVTAFMQSLFSSTLIAQGRLSLTSGTAVTTTDVSGATSIKWVPVFGRYIPVNHGGATGWLMRDTGGELSLSLDSNSGHSGYQQSGKTFDIFYAYDGATLVYGTGPAWTNATTRSAAVSQMQGVWTNTNSITLRTGTASGDTVSIPAGQATLLGSFVATADGQASDTLLRRYLSNVFNRTPRVLTVIEATTSWDYPSSPGASTAFRQVRASSNNQVSVLSCLPDIFVELEAAANCIGGSGTPISFTTGVGIGNATNVAQLVGYQAQSTAEVRAVRSTWRGFPGLGTKDLWWLEQASGVSFTTTWYGTDSGARAWTNGLHGKVWN